MPQPTKEGILYMKYFESVITFVDEHLIWAVWLFLAAVAVELIVFLIRSKSNYGFETENFYISVVSNVTGLLGLYVLSCLCVGFVNCVKDQNYHFWTNYKHFIFETGWGTTLCCIIGVAALIILFIVIPAEIFGKLIGAVLGTGIALLVFYFVGFLVYVILAFVWIILKLVWFVVTGFFQSIFQFVVKYWKWMLLVLVTPGLIYGAINALVNYIISLKDEVFIKD